MNKNLYILIASLVLIFSCSDDIDKSNRYVFTGETLGSYINNRPTNEGVERFFIEQDSIYHATKNTDKPIWTGITSPYMEDVTDSMANVIVRTHIIENQYTTTHLGKDLGEGEHYLRIKQITENQGVLGFDFIEIVPKSIITDPIKLEDRE